MKKNTKRVLLGLCIVLFSLLFLLLVHPFWVGAAGASVARSIVPDMTKTEFGMDVLGINLYSGNVSTEGVSIKSPGDEKLDAVSLKALKVAFSTPSMFSNERHIKEIVVDGLKVYGDMTFSNLRQIVANINEYVGEEKEETQKSESKLIIDRILITGTEFKWGVVKVPLPDIELKDIGKESPVSNEDAFNTILDAVCDAADKVVAGSGKALNLAIEGGSKIAEGVKAVSGAVGAAVGEVGGAATEVGGKAVDGVKKGLDGVKSLFK